MENSMDDISDEDVEHFRSIVVKRHIATDESQLSLEVNDMVLVLEKDETGWWGGHKEGETQTGWFPGSCVRPIEEREPRNALETGAASPVRRSHAVASPHRTSAASTQSVHDSLRLASENEQLKRECYALEDRLRSAQRQSDADRQSYAQLQGSIEKLQRQVKEQERTLQAERERCSDLDEKNRRLQKQLHEKDQKLQGEEEKTKTLSEENSRLKAAKERQASKETESSFTPARSERWATPGPPLVTSGSLDEAPPIGTVKQMRDMYERNVTPQRDRQVRAFVTPQRVVRTPSQELDFGMSPIRRGQKDPCSSFPRLQETPKVIQKVPQVTVIPPR